ncbi:MAG: hypothetical protein AAB610_02920 [Patescibacteria group bacterium]
MSKGLKISLVILSLVWLITQLPAVFYGTQKLALHMSYIGDEQAPINGALKILQERSLLGMRNAQTVYYGPIFSIIALPAVIADFSEKFLFSGVRSASDYRDHILWNWGGIVWKARLISVLFSFLSLLIVFKLFCTETFNPSSNKYLPLAVTVLLSTNFLFFEYGHFFRHWIFILFSIVGMLYSIVRLHESGERKYFYHSLFFTIFGFGISYLSIIFMTLWLPLLFVWIKGRNYFQLKRFAVFLISLIAFASLVVVWNPHPFFRIVGLTGGDIVDTDTTQHSLEKSPIGLSFSYYSRILLNNQLPLLIAIALMTIYLCIKQKIYRRFWFWTLILPGSLFFLLFGLMGHHESRYILPIMVLLVLYAGILASHSYSKEFHLNKHVSIIFITLISSVFVFNIFIDGLLIKTWMQSPKETELIRDLQKLQIEESDAKTLVVKHYLLGAAHTKEAYKAYTDMTNKSSLNLYKAIQETDLPKDSIPLSIRYSIPDYFILTKDLIDEYDHIIYYYEFDWHQRSEPDYFDLNALNLLLKNQLGDSYYFIK